MFSVLTVPWWIAGGYAIELFVGHAVRPHGDIDPARRAWLAEAVATADG